MVRERAGERGGESGRETQRDHGPRRRMAGCPPPDTSKTTNAPVSTDEKTKSTEYRVERQRNVR
jgi:hypothetical protein